MKNSFLRRLLSALALLPLLTSHFSPLTRAAEQSAPFELKDGDRVVFLGDTFNGGNVLAKVLESNKTMYLVVSVNHTLTGEQFVQRIKITEESQFNTVTNIAKTRWTIAGRVGRLNEAILPVQLEVECYFSESENQKIRRPHSLVVDRPAKFVSGGVHGIGYSASVWTKLGIDEKPFYAFPCKK